MTPRPETAPARATHPRDRRPATAAPPPPPDLRVADDRLARVTIGILRVVMAFMWIENTRWKLPPDFGRSRKADLYEFVADGYKYPVFQPYAWLSQHLILPHLNVFGWFVLATEATIGACLLAGFLTRLVGLVAAAQAFVIFLSASQAPGEWPWSYYLMIVGSLAIAGTAAGRFAGLDGVLRPRLLRAGGALRRAAILT